MKKECSVCLFFTNCLCDGSARRIFQIGQRCALLMKQQTTIRSKRGVDAIIHHYKKTMYVIEHKTNAQ